MSFPNYVNQTKLEPGSLQPDLVAVMLGAISGVGAATAREIAQSSRNLKIYIVGQNSLRGNALVEELQSLNSRANIVFIQSDLSLLWNVNKVCAQIATLESGVNLLYMTCGILSLSGRNETVEGIDKVYVLQYFSRIRAIVNLLPLLSSAARQKHLARVVSVLGAGNEGQIFTDDFPLKENYSLRNCSSQAITMTTLTLEALGRKHTAIDFTYAHPGAVRGTNIINGFGKPLASLMQFMIVLFAPISSSLAACAKTQKFIATGDIQILEWSRLRRDGTTAVLRLNSKAQLCGPKGVLTKYLLKGLAESIWEYTEEGFRRVCGGENADV